MTIDINAVAALVAKCALAHSYLAFPATAFVVIFGAMLTPVTLAMTRPLHLMYERLARQAAWNACKAVLIRAVRWVASIATAGAALSLLIAVTAAPANAQTSLDAVQKTTTQAIERMIGILDKAAKHPVIQGAKVIARGYTAVKVYRLSKEVKGLKTDVAALNTSVHAILTEVTGVIARVEADEELTAAELDAVNARIDVHAIQIAAAEAEIEVLKLRMDEADRKQRDQDRRQRGIERQQREADQRQREADTRQRETDMRVAAQQKMIGRDSKTPNLYFDPKCQCRRDIRDRDTAGGT